MIIDFHTHIFPDKIANRVIQKLENAARSKAFTDGTLKGLSRSMTQDNINCSIVVPVATNPMQTDNINKFAVSINENFSKTGIWSFGGIHPDDSHYKETLRHIKELGLAGIKLHPDYQDTYFDDIRYMRIVDYASQLGLVIIVHAGVDIGMPQSIRCTPQNSRRLVDDVQPNKLVLAHMGGWKMWDDVERYLVGQNVYLDTSFSLGELSRDLFYGHPVPKEPLMGKEQFFRILHSHGADRILFATDSPWSGQAESVAYLQSLSLKDIDLKKIFSLNARKLLPFLSEKSGPPAKLVAWDSP